MRPFPLRRASAAALALAGALAASAAAAGPPHDVAATPHRVAAGSPSHELPAAVESALARAGVKSGAMVAWVESVDGGEPRLAWQAERPANPASPK